MLLDPSNKVLQSMALESINKVARVITPAVEVKLDLHRIKVDARSTSHISMLISDEILNLHFRESN